MTATPLSLTAVVNYYPAPSQTFIRRKLEGLQDQGVSVQVATTTFSAPAAERGFPFVPLAPWQHLGSALDPANRRSWQAIAREMLTAPRDRTSGLRGRLVSAPLGLIESDIVHFEFSGIAVTYLDALAHLAERCRLVVSCRGSGEQIEPLRDPRRAEALAQVFEQVDLIHCVSDDMRRTVEALHAPRDKIIVNRPAVPVASFVPLRSRPERHAEGLRVLSIGRLHWKKGLDDGLRAIAHLRSQGQNVHYRIAGEGAEREKLTFLIDQLGLNEVVQLLGTQTETEIKELLSWADALLLPSLSEGISNAVLEAMASGLPVVSTDCGGMTEVVSHDLNGLVVPVGDVAAMAEHLGALGHDAALRARLGAEAARYADEELDVSRQVAVFMENYRRILDTPRAGR